MAYKKAVLIPVTVAMHARFKHKVEGEGRSMARVARGLISEYLDGERSVVGLDPEGENDIYDQIAEQVRAAVE